MSLCDPVLFSYLKLASIYNQPLVEPFYLSFRHYPPMFSLWAHVFTEILVVLVFTSDSNIFLKLNFVELLFVGYLLWLNIELS
jgi:hypothetical protein